MPEDHLLKVYNILRIIANIMPGVNTVLKCFNFCGVCYILTVYKEAQTMPNGNCDNVSGRHARKSPDIIVVGKLY